MTTADTATTFTLRPATPDDCAALVRLITALAERLRVVDAGRKA